MHLSKTCTDVCWCVLGIIILIVQCFVDREPEEDNE